MTGWGVQPDRLVGKGGRTGRAAAGLSDTVTATSFQIGHHAGKGGQSRPASRIAFTVGGITAVGRAPALTASIVFRPSPVL